MKVAYMLWVTFTSGDEAETDKDNANNKMHFLLFSRSLSFLKESIRSLSKIFILTGLSGGVDLNLNLDNRIHHYQVHLLREHFLTQLTN